MLPDREPPAFPPATRERAGAIVLVHGAWVGEWCWAPVLPWLRESGRPVYAVSLAGHGVRRHEAGPHITLGDHVSDLVGLVETLDLVDVTLVAHSYGGRVATRALERIGDRVARVVYLDAHAPLPGVDPLDAVPIDPAASMIPFASFDPDPAEFGGPASVAWFRERVVAQSAATLREPFAVALPEHLDLTYVRAVGDAASPFAAYGEAARLDARWRYLELPGSHWMMVSRPREVAAIVLDPTAMISGTHDPRDPREKTSDR